MTMKDSNDILGRLSEMLTLDRKFNRTMAVYLTVIVILVGLAGLTVWPVVLQLRGFNASLDKLLNVMCTVNVALLALDFIIGLLFMLLEKDYSMAKPTSVCVVIGAAVNFALLVMQVNLVQSAGFMVALFWVIMSGMCGVMLSLLPSVCACLVTAVMHAVIKKLLDWRG